MEQSGTSASELGYLPMTTLGDALIIAMDFEQSASSLYGHFAQRMDSQVRPLLRQLAVDAKAHFELSGTDLAGVARYQGKLEAA